MIVVAYAVSYILFAIADVIAGGMVLAISTRYVARTVLTPSTAQFIGAFAGSAVGGIVGPFAFGWFDKSANLIVWYVIAEIIWLLTNATIAAGHSPTVQRVGAVLGLTIAFIVKSI